MFLFFLVGVYIVYIVWVLICNERVYYWRNNFISLLGAQCSDNKDSHYRLFNMYSSVSYDDHFDALMFFSDWRKLYPEELRSAVPKAFE